VREIREGMKCNSFLELDLKKRDSRISTSSQEQKTTNVRWNYSDGAVT
jgi:hypothetical protein